VAQEKLVLSAPYDLSDTGGCGYSRADLHLHGSGSSDSRTETAVLFERAVDLGISIVANTDHDTTKKGGEAQAAAEARGLLYIPGSAEITTRLAPGQWPHIVVYNVPPDQLDKYVSEHPFRPYRLRKLTHTKELLEWVKLFPDALAVAAHPRENVYVNSLSFRQVTYFESIGLLDGMEVLSGFPGEAGLDIKRKALAQGLGADFIQMGNSDAHEGSQVGHAQTIFSGHPRTAAEAINCLRQNQCRPFRPEWAKQPRQRPQRLSVGIERVLNRVVTAPEQILHSR
jgi:hypothetical protein